MINNRETKKGAELSHLLVCKVSSLVDIKKEKESPWT